MTTKEEMIETIKLEYTSLRVGNEQDGYETLSDDKYEQTIASWAEAKLARQKRDAERQQLRLTRIAAYEKLGLSKEEIEALVPTPQPKKL